MRVSLSFEGLATRAYKFLNTPLKSQRSTPVNTVAMYKMTSTAGVSNYSLAHDSKAEEVVLRLQVETRTYDDELPSGCGVDMQTTKTYISANQTGSSRGEFHTAEYTCRK